MEPGDGAHCDNRAADGTPMLVGLLVNFVTAWGDILCATRTNDQAARTMPVVLAAPGRNWAMDCRTSRRYMIVWLRHIAFTFAQKLSSRHDGMS